MLRHSLAIDYLKSYFTNNYCIDNYYLLEAHIYWFKVVFSQTIKNFWLRKMQNIILSEMRFDPHMARLNIKKIEKIKDRDFNHMGGGGMQDASHMG